MTDSAKRICVYCGQARPEGARHCGAADCRKAYRQHRKGTFGASARRAPDDSGPPEKVRPTHLTDVEWQRHLDNLAACYAADAERLYAAGMDPSSCSSHLADRVLKND